MAIAETTSNFASLLSALGRRQPLRCRSQALPPEHHLENRRTQRDGILVDVYFAGITPVRHPLELLQTASDG